MELIQESTIKALIIEDEDKNLYIKGPTLVYDKVNINKRLYPHSILSESIKKHLGFNEENLNEGACVGELNHPISNNSGDIDYDRISHKFIEVIDNGKYFETKALVLDTDKGKQLRKLIEGKVRIGISSRAFGDVKKENSVNVIQNLHLISLGDIVHNPSAPGAYVEGILENAEWIWESGKIIKKDISNIIDKHKIIIEKASLNEISRVSKNIFLEYLKNIEI